MRAVDRTGKSALHYCAENQNVACLEQLLELAPALLDQADREGYTPLHLAVIVGPGAGTGRRRHASRGVSLALYLHCFFVSSLARRAPRFTGSIFLDHSSCD